MYRRLLVVLGNPGSSAVALTEAMRLAATTAGASLRVVAVVDVPLAVLTAEGANEPAVERASRRRAQARIAAAEFTLRTAGIAAEAVIRDAIGTPIADGILSEAREWHADAIVVGVPHRRWFVQRDWLLRNLIRDADCPVVVVEESASHAGRA